MVLLWSCVPHDRSCEFRLGAGFMREVHGRSWQSTVGGWCGCGGLECFLKSRCPQSAACMLCSSCARRIKLGGCVGH